MTDAFRLGAAANFTPPPRKIAEGAVMNGKRPSFPRLMFSRPGESRKTTSGFAAAPLLAAALAAVLGFAGAALAQTTNYAEDFTIPQRGADSMMVPAAIWTGTIGTTEIVYVLSSGNDHIWAYERRGGEFSPNNAEDIRLDQSVNTDPGGIWSDGTTMYVSDHGDNMIYAYTIATSSASSGARDNSKEFSLATANSSARGIWSDGTTMWVVNNSNSFVYSYTLNGGAQDTDKDFTLTDNNEDGRGAWSDGTTLWVADGADDIAYAYTLAFTDPNQANDFGKNIPSTVIGTAGTLAGIAGVATEDLMLVASQDGANDRVRGIRISDRTRFQPIVALNVRRFATDVEEGAANPSFEVNAASAPAANLEVPVVLSQRGGYYPAADLGERTVTIAAGNTAVTLEVGATPDDRTDEPDGELFLSLGTPPSGYRVGTGSTSVSVLDDDLPPMLVEPDPAAGAGEGAGTLVIPINVAQLASNRDTGGNLSDFTIMVDYATELATHASVTAEAEDFTAASGTLTWEPGDETAKHITVNIMADADTDDERLAITLSNPMNVRYPDGTSSGTYEHIYAHIRELPTVSIAADAAMVTEGADAVFILTLSAAAPGGGLAVPVTVAQFSTTSEVPNVHLVAADDLGEREAIIPAGETEVRFTVPIIDDNTDEPEARVRATLGALPSGYAGSGFADIEVDDDEDFPVVSVAGGAGGGPEGGEALFTVLLAAGEEPAAGEVLGNGNVSDFTVTVHWATTKEPGDTAVAGTDFTATSGILTFHPGDTEAQAVVDLPMADDDLMEHTFTFTLTIPFESQAYFADYTAASLTAVGTVFELPGLSIALADPAMTSITEAQGPAAFVVSLTRLPDGEAAVTVPVTVTPAGNLHGALPDSVTIPAGALMATLNVPLDNDARDEDDGGLSVEIMLPDDGFVFSGATTATLQVTDDDAEPSVSIADAAEALEGEALMFPVRLSGASERAISVAYTTEAGDDRATATAGRDYDESTGTLRFAPNATEAVVQVATRRDDETDPDEIVVLTLSEPMNATLNPDAMSAAGVIREGLSAAEITALNKAILPHIATAVAEETTSAIQDRVRAAYEGGREANGLSIAGADAGDYVRGLLPGDVLELKDWRLPAFAATDFNFNASLNADGGAGGIPPLAVWGRGYYRDLAVDAGAIEFDGDVTGYMLGADARLRSALVGVAVNHAQSDIEWDNSDFTGAHETTLTALHPYFGWRSKGGLRLWGSLGYGEGELELTEAGNAAFMYERDVSLRAAAFGGHGPLLAIIGGKVDLGVILDAAYVQLRETGDSTGAEAESASAESGWMRLGVDADYRQPLPADAVLGARAELALRGDFGDAKAGTGVELGSQLDYQHPVGVRVDLKARALLNYRDEGDVEEWGVSGGIAYSTPAARGTASALGGRGFTLSFSPEWGITDSTRDQLWNGGFSTPAHLRHSRVSRPQAQGNPEIPALRYNLEVQYGLPVLQGRELLTFFARSDLRSDARNYALGADFKLGDYITAGYESTLNRRAPLNLAPAAGGSATSDHRAYLRFERRF